MQANLQVQAFVVILTARVLLVCIEACISTISLSPAFKERHFMNTLHTPRVQSHFIHVNTAITFQITLCVCVSKSSTTFAQIMHTYV